MRLIEIYELKRNKDIRVILTYEENIEKSKNNDWNFFKTKQYKPRNAVQVLSLIFQLKAIKRERKWFTDSYDVTFDYSNYK